MKVSILGVIAGGFADVVTSFLLGIPLAATARLLTLSTHRGLDAVAAETTWARMHAHPIIWAIGTLIGLLCSAFGGYVAAAIAGRSERLNGTLSCWLCICVAILFLPLGLNKDPWWLQVFLMLPSLVMAFAGGDLRLRHVLRKAGIAIARESV